MVVVADGMQGDPTELHGKVRPAGHHENDPVRPDW